MNELKDKKNGSLEGHLGTTHNRLILQEFYNSNGMSKFEVQSTGIKNFQTEKFLDNFLVPTLESNFEKKIDDISFKILNLIHLLGNVSEFKSRIYKNNLFLNLKNN